MALTPRATFVGLIRAANLLEELGRRHIGIRVVNDSPKHPYEIQGFAKSPSAKLTKALCAQIGRQVYYIVEFIHPPVDREDCEMCRKLRPRLVALGGEWNPREARESEMSKPNRKAAIDAEADRLMHQDLAKSGIDDPGVIKALGPTLLSDVETRALTPLMGRRSPVPAI